MPMWTDSPTPAEAAPPASPEERRAERQARRAAEARRLRRRRLTVTLTVLALVLTLAVAMPLALRSGGSEATASVATPSPSPSTTKPTMSAPTAKSTAPTESATPEPQTTTETVSADDPAPEADQLPVLTEGDYGSVIEIAQRALGVQATGYFGPKTKAAVASFQEANGLPATGMIAEYTWTALGTEALAEAVTASASPEGFVNSRPAAGETSATATRSARRTAEPPVLEETDSGDSVAVVQRALGVRPASGYFGPVTAKAVRRFQADNGIPTTGVVAQYTWAALGSEVAGEAAAAHAAYGTDFGPGVDKKRSGGGGNSGGNGGGGNGGGGSATQGSRGLFCPVENFTYGDGLGAARPGGRTHAGLDLMGSRGEPIYAIDSGEVTRAEWQSNGALVLDITGSSGMYFYGHFDEILVSYGEWVKAGQLIGYMGDTGSPGAVHLHLEVRPNGWSGGYEDPVPLIQSLCG